MTSASPRILMYTQDSLGLGHLRRATNLANELVTRRPDLSVLLVVDSPVAPFFALRPHIDFVKLPTVVKVDAGVFSPGRLHTGYERVKALRSSLLREALLHFAPHVLLVDHMPGGANRELLPALENARREGLSTRVVLGLRDIIDDPAVTRAVWQREGVYDILRREYHRVLVYGTPDVFDTAENYRLEGALDGRVDYCGYVCNMDAVPTRERVRAAMRLSAEPLVVVMGGGGADAARLMETYLAAAPIAARARSFTSLLVTGPFLPQAQLKALQARARAHRIRLRTSVGDALEQIHAADVVVSMAGYNTLSEILRFGKRAIVVPRPGPSAEQSMRARLFAARGLFDVLELAHLEPRSLAEALARALDPEHVSPPRAVPALDGLARASAALLDELPAPAPLLPPVRAAGRRVESSTQGI
jgi:predicted glycosyltransferase